jgi:hypothetical protein
LVGISAISRRVQHSCSGCRAPAAP